MKMVIDIIHNVWEKVTPHCVNGVLKKWPEAVNGFRDFTMETYTTDGGKKSHC
jgi:hypothetical protein